jgi:hypothetical protein
VQREREESVCLLGGTNGQNTEKDFYPAFSSPLQHIFTLARSQTLSTQYQHLTIGRRWMMSDDVRISLLLQNYR